MTGTEIATRDDERWGMNEAQMFATNLIQTVGPSRELGKSGRMTGIILRV